ncbi:BolA family transcriptional regulator [soil metagenome]
MIAPAKLRDILLVGLPGATVEVTDTTGTQDHFQAVVIAPQFAGKSRVEQHQLVYSVLGDRMKQEIHALALTTREPAK